MKTFKEFEKETKQTPISYLPLSYLGNKEVRKADQPQFQGMTPNSEIDVRKCVPSQCDFDHEKIHNLMDFFINNSGVMSLPIVVSKRTDGNFDIVDGHHRAIAAYNTNNYILPAVIIPKTSK